jgi:KaiC/GvpD/RAD55 family RecA-like ATPase
MPAVAERLLGEPNARLSTQTELRFGSNGSLRVSIGGPNKGTWRSHEEQVGGGVLDLVAHQLGGDRRAALDWLKAEFPDFAGAPEERAGKAKIVATYPYYDELGEVLFESVRMEPKTFRQRQPDGRGGWVWNLKGVRPVPYHLPEIGEAIALGRTVFIAEGEKDVDALWAAGIPATCNPGGAGKWRHEYSEIFKDAHVVVLPDNDEPGAAHGEQVAKALSDTAASVKVLQLPNLPRKGDVSDWLASGGTGSALLAMAEEASAWRPQQIRRLPAVWYGDEDKEPQLSWLVKGVLIEGGLSAVFGAPGSTKTFLVLDMALHIAHGRDFFGHRVAAGGVVYVSGEGGAGMRLRMKAWRQERNGSARVPFVMVPTSVNLFDDNEGVEALISDIRAHAETMGQPCRLVVLDTLSRMIGSGDEDRAHDVNVIVQRADRIQRETGAHVLVVHHSGKDKDRGMRGSNALLGAVDAAIEVTRHDSGFCEAKIAKVKDGGSAEPFRYNLAQSVLGQDEDGEDITSCVVSAADASTRETEGGRKAKLNDRERIALEALREAAIANGKAGQGGAVPTTARTVTVEEWRTYAYQRGLSGSSEPDALRQAFKRVREKLQARGLTGTWGELVWEA